MSDTPTSKELVNAAKVIAQPMSDAQLRYMAGLYLNSPPQLEAHVISQLSIELLAARKTIADCRAAGFIDDEGKVRRVLGTLPITKDGVLLGQSEDGIDMPVFIIRNWKDGPSIVQKKFASYIASCDAVADCYSTREAAEAARNGGE